MNVLKIFTLILFSGLVLVQCKPKTDVPAEGAATEQSAPAAGEGSLAAGTQDDQPIVPPPAPAYDQSQLYVYVGACDRYSSIINDQIIQKEYDLSKNPEDQELVALVAKLKELQVRFSQVKAKLETVTAEDWQKVWDELQIVGMESKRVLKPLMQ